MKWKQLFTIACLSTSAFIFVSCTTASQIGQQQKYQYNIFVNSPNQIGNYNFHPTGINEYVTNNSQSLGSAFLFNYHYQQPVTFDYLNNRVELPSIRSLKFNLALSLELTFSDNSKINYDNDEAEIVPPPNLGRGYQEQLINAYSENNQSINNKDFLSNLNKAKKIVIKLKPKNYVNYQNQKTQYQLTANDFYFSLMQNHLRAAQNRHGLNFDFSLIPNKIYEQYFNTNDDYKTKLMSYGLNVDQLYDKNNYQIENQLIFNNNDKWEFASFFQEQLNQNLIFSPLSSNFVIDNQQEQNFGLTWYQKTLEQTLFLSNYVMVENSLTSQRWHFNSSLEKADNQLSQVLFQYALVPLNSQSYEQKIFDDFNNGLLANIELNQLGWQKRQQLLEKNVNAKINYAAIMQQNSNPIKSFVNWLAPQNGQFNQNYQIIFYGNNQENQWAHVFSKKVFELRNNLSNYFNYYAFNYLARKNNYWNSYANSTIPLSGLDAAHNNYHNLLDAYVPINRFNIILENQLLTETILDQEQSFFQLTNQQKLLENNFSKKIRSNIIRLLDYFYHKNNLQGTLDWTIPIYKTNLNSNEFNALEKSIDLIKSIDSRLNPSLIIVNDQNSLVQLQKDQNYALIYNDLNNNVNSFASYLKALFTNKTNSLLVPLLYLNLDSKFLPYYNNFQKEFFAYLKTKNIFKEKLLQKKNNSDLWKSVLDTNPNFSLIIEKFLQEFENKQTNFAIISLLNQIDTVYTKPLTIDSFANNSNLSEELIQKRFKKPYFANNIINFSDIKVEKGDRDV